LGLAIEGGKKSKFTFYMPNVFYAEIYPEFAFIFSSLSIARGPFSLHLLYAFIFILLGMNSVSVFLIVKVR